MTLGGRMPDLTPAQIKADVIFVTGLAATLGLRIGDQTTNTVTVALIAALALAKAVAYLADAAIRRGRAHALSYNAVLDPSGNPVPSLAPSDVEALLELLADLHRGTPAAAPMAPSAPLADRIAASAATDQAAREANGPAPPPGTAPIALAGDPEPTGS